MKCSVVMATYNGAHFLEEQMQSLYSQTIQPDEVIISDDRSSDKTVQIAESFILQNHLQDRWRVTINDSNKGANINFVDAANSANGDIVFFSDDDDIWHPRKIEILLNKFAHQPDMLACAHVDTYIDEEGEPINCLYRHLARMPLKAYLHKVSFSEMIKYNQSTGHNMAVKNKFMKEVRKFILAYNLTYDLPIGMVASIYDGYYILNQKLVLWRQHSSNSSTPHLNFKSRLSDIAFRITGQEERLRHMEAVYGEYGKHLEEKEKNELKQAIEWTRMNNIYLKSKSTKRLFRQIFKCNPMINRWLALNDFLVCIMNL